MQYTKSALSLSQQISLLRSRNLAIPDQLRAEKYLRHIGYYRLSAYMIPYYKDQANHQFEDGTEFDDLLSIYIFDRKLRVLLLEAIERIEISFRSVVTDEFVFQLGPHAYLHSQYFDTRYNHSWLVKKVQDEMDKSSEVFIGHYKRKYNNPSLPPLWMSAQLLSFKEIVMFYQNIKVNKVKKSIASIYGLQDEVLISWMRSLSDLRNLCAHHSRVWNRVFGSKAVLPKRKPEKWLSRFPDLIHMGDNQRISPRKSLYYQIVIIWYFLYQTSPNSTWLKRFKSLCEYYQVDMRYLGFPFGWEAEQFWKGK